jgi:hypothetical protein
MKGQKGYNPITAAGMVLVGVGGNELQGGQNKAPTSDSFPIADATVEVDGQVIVRNGQLVAPTTAKAAPGGKKTKSGSR